MKKITFLLLMALIAHTINAQECTVTLPYTETFTSDNLLQCTSVEAISGNEWDVTPVDVTGYSGPALRYTAANLQANSWFFCKPVYLTVGSYYKLDYLYGNDSPDTSESFRITLNYNSDPAMAFANLAIHTNVTGASVAHNATSEFTVSESGTYYIGINATSAANQGELYLDDLTIRELPCPTPSNFNLAARNETSVVIEWNRQIGGNTPTGFYYAWSTTNAIPETTTFTSSGYAYIQDLTPGTTYYFFAKSDCSQGAGEWSQVFEFTTRPCDTASLPYTENFDYVTFPALPLCTYTETISGNDWVTQRSFNSDLGGLLQYNSSNEHANAWYFTRAVNLTAGQYYKINYEYAATGESPSQDFKITLGTNPSAQAATITAAEHTNVTSSSLQYGLTSAISVPQTGTYYIGVDVTSAANQGNLLFNSIKISEWGSCDRPLQSRVSNTSDTSALVSWMSSRSMEILSGYTYAYSTTNSIPLNGTFTAENYIELINLEPNTTYYFYVRTNCGPVESDWNSFLTFKTAPCTAVNLPYAIDFESSVAPAHDECLTLVGNTTYMPYVENNPGYGFTNNTFTFPAAVDVNGGLQLISRGVYLDSGKYYRVSYRYGTSNTNGTGSLDVWMYDNYNIANLNSTAFWVGSHYRIEGNTPNTHILNTVRPQQSGIQYFTFKGYGNYGDEKIYVDDFQIEELYCEEPTQPTLIPTAANRVSITWNAPNLITDGVTYIYQYKNSTSNSIPETWTTTSRNSATLNNLTPNTTYYLFVRTSVDQTVFSDWITIPYTTAGILGTVDTATNKLVIYPNPVKDILTINGTDTIDKVELYNITGQLIYSNKINAKDAVVNMEKFAAGAYMLTINSNGSVKKQTIIKQ